MHKPKGSTALVAVVAVLAACDQPHPTAPSGAGDAAFAAVGHGPTVIAQRKLDANLTPLALYPLDTDPGTFDPFKQNLAQTFVAPRTGELRYVYMPIACVPDVLLRIQIRDGGPDGPLLTDNASDPAVSSAHGDFLTFQIGDPNPPPVVAGNTYAIVLSSLPRSTAIGETCSIIAGPPGDRYTGGQAWYNNPGFLPYWNDVLLQTPSGSYIMGDLPFIARIF